MGLTTCNFLPSPLLMFSLNAFYCAGALVFRRAFFGGGLGSIFLDQVDCSGFESMLTQCPANPIGIHDCSHSEDAGVQCALTGM